ncbi:hypothetical protein GGI05_002467 [Coemansia sp. RSA 2603]|nr:hypothetical protein GGI05_002467 [Coemansia sp. RSA 2603]
MSELGELIDTLTAGGQETLDGSQVTQLKRRCRDGGASAVQQAFAHLMQKLSARQASVRLASLRLLDVLFTRSHEMRQLATRRLAEILGLTLGAYGQRRAHPEEQAAELRRVSGQMVHEWARRFGVAYPRLVYGAWHVRYTEGISPVWRTQRAGRLDVGRRRYAGRMAEAVRMGVNVWRAQMRMVVQTVERAVRVLDDDMFAETDGYASECSVDADEALAVVAGNRHHVSVSLGPDDMLASGETPDTAPVYAVLRDALRQCLALRERVQRWVGWLERLVAVEAAQGAGELHQKVLAWNARLRDAVERIESVGVDVAAVTQSSRLRGQMGGESSAGSEDEFEEVDAGRVRAARQQRPQSVAARDSGVFALLDAGAALASDPTYVDQRELLRLRRAMAPAPRPLRPLSAVEQELMRSAPVVPFDTDLLYWGKREVPLAAGEVRHRFLGAARDAPEVSGEELGRLQMRAVRFSSLGSVGGGTQAQGGGGFSVDEPAETDPAEESAESDPVAAASPPAAETRRGRGRGRKRPGSAIARLQAAMKRRR